MDYQTQRNSIIRKYVDYGSRHHLNCIRHDSNASEKHRKKVNEICDFLIEKNLDFICRPIIKNWFRNPVTRKTVKWDYIADILFWIKKPFISKIVEVFDSEKEEHAKDKNYPEEFRVIVIDVDDILGDYSEI